MAVDPKRLLCVAALILSAAGSPIAAPLPVRAISGTVVAFSDTGEMHPVPNLRLEVIAASAWDGAVGGQRLPDVVTDAEGRYTVTDVPAVILFFRTAPGSEYRFLCDAFPIFAGMPPFPFPFFYDLPVVHTSWSGNTLPPNMWTPGTSVIGTVSERVDGSLQPVAGATVIMDLGLQDPPATTSSTGFYMICSVVGTDQSRTMTAQKPGYNSVMRDIVGGWDYVADFELTRNAACPAIVTQTLPVGTSGQPYWAAVTVSGGSGSVAWELHGALPAGLNWLGGGVFSGTPTQHGTFAFSVTVTDTVNGCVQSRSFVLRVTPQALEELVYDGTFSTGFGWWGRFATPDFTYIVARITDGVLEFYRELPASGTNQAVVLQNTGVPIVENGPLVLQFDAGNSSAVPKRLSVLLTDSDFSDLAVCTFWIAPNTPLATYRMKTHTTKAWANAAMYFYAASPLSWGGYYQLDNVSLKYAPAESDARTDCVDPTAPSPPGGADSANLLGNGDFEAGALAPWGAFGTLTHQIASGVLEFIRPSGTPPAGVVLQSTNEAIEPGQILTATFQLGNSSSVRKRVTVILHDNDFSDLAACTFWLAPGQPLSDYAMRTFTTRAWANATVSLYPATAGADQWIRLDNATFRRTPSAAIAGTSCLEPRSLLIR